MSPPVETSKRIVAGVQPVREAIRVHGQHIEKIVVSSSGGPRLDAVARFARDQGIDVERVAKARIDKLARGGRHQGVLAYAPDLKILTVDEVEVSPDTVFVMLDKITDPQNFGAVIRCTVALGGTGIIWGQNQAAPLSAATFRASAGAVEHARLVQTNSLRDALEQLAAQGVQTIALDADAPRSLSEVDLTGPTLLVVGAEDKGVTRGIRRACATTAHLPMPGPIGSLNASVATAVALYEVLRQRQ